MYPSAVTSPPTTRSSATTTSSCTWPSSGIQNGFLLELCKYDNPKGQQRELDNIFVGASHLAFEVEDVVAQYRALVAAGFSAINPPVDVERDGQVVARAMYALDPDGISIEMFQEFGDIVSR